MAEFLPLAPGGSRARRYQACQKRHRAQGHKRCGPSVPGFNHQNRDPGSAASVGKGGVCCGVCCGVCGGGCGGVCGGGCGGYGGGCGGYGGGCGGYGGGCGGYGGVCGGCGGVCGVCGGVC